MNVQEVIDILKKDGVSLRLYFTRKRGTRYISYSPEVDTPLQSKLKQLIVEYLGDFLDTEQIEFSPVGYREETIEKCQVGYINKHGEVIESYRTGQVNRDPISDEIINQLSFYCLELIDNENSKITRFFRRVTKFKKLSAKGIMGNIRNNNFKEMDCNMLGIDGFIDLIEHDGEILILNHIYLERIFSLSDQYTEKAQNALDFIRCSNRIKNIDQFEEDCLNDRRITRTLTKMLTEELKLENCFENFPNVVNVIEIFELEIDIDNSGEVDTIVYDNKEQLMDIIRLVRDSYYRSMINERAGIHDGI